MQSLSFARYVKDELLHLLEQLLVGYAACAPSMHTEIALRVEVTIRKDASLTPEVQCFALFIVKESHNTFLVEDIGLFADKGAFHLVDGLLEEFLVLADQQLFDALKTTLSLRN